MFRLGINYNNEPDIYRKGSMLYRDVQLFEVYLALKLMQISILTSTLTRVCQNQ